METQIRMLPGFGEESEKEVKEVVKPTCSNYTWEHSKLPRQNGFRQFRISP